MSEMKLSVKLMEVRNTEVVGPADSQPVSHYPNHICPVGVLGYSSPISHTHLPHLVHVPIFERRIHPLKGTLSFLQFKGLRVEVLHWLQ